MTRTGRSFPFKLVAGVLGLAGLLLLITSAALLLNLRGFLAQALPAQGTVLRVVDRNDPTIGAGSRPGAGGREHMAEVRFVTQDGRTVEFADDISAGLQDYHAGDTVPVLYDPLEAQQAHIDAFYSLWMLPLLILVLGISFAAAAGGTALGLWRSGRAGSPDPQLAGDNIAAPLIVALAWNTIVGLMIGLLWLFGGAKQLWTGMAACVFGPLIGLGILMLLGSILRIAAASRRPPVAGGK